MTSSGSDSAKISQDIAVRFRRQGPFPVSVLREKGFDASRLREVPVKVHFPATGEGPFPVVFFSHGLGGSREGYAYLGRHWASHGIIAVHVQHAGTDKSLFKGRLDVVVAMRDAAKAAGNLLNRTGDIRFCIDRLLRAGADPRSAFHGRIDPGRIAVAGHSMGAVTALACAGRRLPGTDGAPADRSDPRVRACVSMSASSGDPESSRPFYEDFRTPCLHMTTTNDASPIGGTEARHRRVPYDSIRRGDQFLVIFRGGDHMIFSDHRVGRKITEPDRPSLPQMSGAAAGREGISDEGKTDPFYHRHIRMATTVFWDAFLNENRSSREWLRGGGLKDAFCLAPAWNCLAGWA